MIWNSTTLDCSRKFRNFWNSTKAVRRLSDTICMEHGLSVIENPVRKGMTYEKWLGGSAKVSNREILRKAIDDILTQNPRDMDEFLRLLEAKGFTVKRGKHVTLKYKDFKKAIRMDSLGDGYTEEDIRAVLLGKRKHVQRQRSNLLIEIDSKLRMNKTTAKSATSSRWRRRSTTCVNTDCLTSPSCKGKRLTSRQSITSCRTKSSWRKRG